jgi:hypothetical protein
MSRNQNLENMSSKTRTAYKVSTKKFDIKRVVFDKVFTEKKKTGGDQKDSKQYTYFPKYKYPELDNSNEDDDGKKASNGETLALQTEFPVEFKRGGVPKYNPEFHKEGKHKTCFFWLPTDEEYGGKGGVEFGNAVRKLDDKFGKEIQATPDEYLYVKEGKDNEPIEGLKYVDTVRKAPKPEKVAKKDFNPWNRCKVNIPYTLDPKTQEPIIKVKIAYPNEETGKIDTMVATSLEQLGEVFRYGCKAELIVDVKTFWVLKSSKACGFKLTCEMIRITELSKTFAPKEHTWDDFVGGNGEEDVEVVESKPAKKPVKKSESDDDEAKPTKKDDSDDEEDSKPVKKPTKKVESEEEEEEVKPVKKPTKKVESDEEEEEVKPVKKPTKPSKPKSSK